MEPQERVSVTERLVDIARVRGVWHGDEAHC
jgi:hypothetical protein